MVRELVDTSSLVERSAGDLSERFHVLAESARVQVSRVEAIVAAAHSIDTGEDKVTLTEATRYIQEVLTKVVETVLVVSKNAMRMLMTPLIFDSCITMPKQARLSWTPLFVSGWVT